MTVFSNPSFSDGPWEFPGMVEWSIPVIVVFILWVILLVEHLLYLTETSEGWEIRYQALYLRIVAVFPLFALLGYIGALFPWITHWMEFIQAFLEAYVLFGFYAFLVGLGYLKSKEFPQILIDPTSNWTNRIFRGCGYRFKTTEGCLKFFFYSVAQFLIVKPTVILVFAVYVQRNGVEPSSTMRTLLNLFGSISVIWATISILRVYKTLKSASDAPLSGHNGLLKIGVVKLLFVFIVLNNLILKNLLYNKGLPIPVSLCEESIVMDNEHFKQFCQDRLVNVIFMIETCICIIPAVFSYRHHGLNLQRTCSCQKVPYFLCLTFFRIFDLGYFWNNKLVKTRVAELTSTSSTDKA